MARTACFMDSPDSVLDSLGSLVLLFNKFAISAGHLLLATEEHRDDLRLEDLESAREFSFSQPEYLVFHNMRGSAASQPQHVHFQAVMRSEPLPIEEAPRRVLARFENDTVMARIEHYPAYGISVTGGNAASLAFGLIRDLRPTPFNLVLSMGETVIIPRKAERPHGFSTAFGGLEMAGCVVLLDEAHYVRVGFGEIHNALAECGWTEEQGRGLEDRLLAIVGCPCLA